MTDCPPGTNTLIHAENSWLVVTHICALWLFEAICRAEVTWFVRRISENFKFSLRLDHRPRANITYLNIFGADANPGLNPGKQDFEILQDGIFLTYVVFSQELSLPLFQ